MRESSSGMKKNAASGVENRPASDHRILERYIQVSVRAVLPPDAAGAVGNCRPDTDGRERQGTGESGLRCFPQQLDQARADGCDAVAVFGIFAAPVTQTHPQLGRGDEGFEAFGPGVGAGGQKAVFTGG